MKKFLCFSFLLGSASQDSQLYCQTGLEGRPPPPSLHQHYFSRSQIDIDPGEPNQTMDITNSRPGPVPQASAVSSKIGHGQIRPKCLPAAFQFFHYSIINCSHGR